MLANAMGKDGFFAHKSILLLDMDGKRTNDRTWCFWEKGKGDFDEILYKTWDHIYFGGKRYCERSPIDPYTYKMIRGIDFYKKYLGHIEAASNICFRQEMVTHIEDFGEAVKVATNKEVYIGKTVFNSIFEYQRARQQQNLPVLQQHFIGWFVKAKKPIFDEFQATFMDFSIPQKGNTRFMYVLPFSETEALVEYTLFSEKVLPEQEYEAAIERYLKENLECESYEIMDKEKGNIPMTCYDFHASNTQNMLHIGTAGGWAKPSTGYTFMNTSKKTKALVQFLKRDKSFKSFIRRTRFWYYDLLLLDILYHDNSKGRHIFETLFKNRDPQAVFKFLDEETSFWEDLKIIGSSPTKEFTTALFRRLF